MTHPGGFGIENLPYGIFEAAGHGARAGVRFEDSVIDLFALLGDDVFASPTLNAFMAQGRGRWDDVRGRVVEHVSKGALPTQAVHAIGDVTMRLPFAVADYVDFYASEHHARNLGRLFRPDSPPLMPNWKYLPVGYHGRSSTVVVSGTDIVRPCGQRKAAEQGRPVFGPSLRLDIEAEIGFVVGAGSPMGTSLRPDDFADHVFGAVLLNDWSARDIQAWEYVPLGPFLGKSFATSISPWVVPLAALDAARTSTPVQDPVPFGHLRGEQEWALGIAMEVTWNGTVISRPQYADMYWSPAQMLAHTTSNGAAASVGDLIGSGTVSGPERESWGSLIELTHGGSEPIEIGGRPRTFLENGDEISITATAPGPHGSRIDFGAVVGAILPDQGVAKNCSTAG